jgi:hypothetical protein
LPEVVKKILGIPDKKIIEGGGGGGSVWTKKNKDLSKYKDYAT